MPACPTPPPPSTCILHASTPHCRHTSLHLPIAFAAWPHRTRTRRPRAFAPTPLRAYRTAHTPLPPPPAAHHHYHYRAQRAAQNLTPMYTYKRRGIPHPHTRMGTSGR